MANFTFKSGLCALLSLAVLLPSFLISPVHASPCLAFDINWNLFVFGVGDHDVNLGTRDAWSNATAVKSVSTTGRPSFDGAATTCYLAQFFNAIYFIGADSSNPTAVHIYDATADSWSTQAVDAKTSGIDVSSLTAILDHDTNVFYAMSQGTLFQMDMSTQKAALSKSVAWEQVESPNFDVTDYKPVMGIAQNHIHFLNIPGSKPGEANIFVIHFAFFQPTPQAYPTKNGGPPFPVTHGSTASFFKSDNVQQRFAFIPDDASGNFLINVGTNDTLCLQAPTVKTPGSIYTASDVQLVQLTADLSLFFLDVSPTSDSDALAAKWTQFGANIPGGLAAQGNSGSRGGTVNGTSGENGAEGGASTTGTSVKPKVSDTNAASGRGVAWMGVALVSAIVGLLVVL